jgi:hypothetical protein
MMQIFESILFDTVDSIADFSAFIEMMIVINEL